MNVPKLILMIDDDPDDREFFALAINEINPVIRTVTVKDGFEGLQYLNQAETLPDFIFLDLNMPRMSGKECLKEIKKKVRFVGIPVIIYSTSRSQVDKEETINLGAAYFLQKPSEFKNICKQISHVLTGQYVVVQEKAFK